MNHKKELLRSLWGHSAPKVFGTHGSTVLFTSFVWALVLSSSSALTRLAATQSRILSGI